MHSLIGPVLESVVERSRQQGQCLLNRFQLYEVMIDLVNTSKPARSAVMPQILRSDHHTKCAASDFSPRASADSAY